MQSFLPRNRCGQGGISYTEELQRVGAAVMDIEKLWDRLEPETRQWLVDNPGCRILPRTVVAAITKATGVQVEQDRHGESSLSPSDCDFLRTASQLQDANSRKSP